ncbi:MAG: hypothetical protein V1826_00590 [bacterium]
MATSPTQPEDPAVLELRAFLASKNSPMPAEELMKYPNWSAIVAISAAESGYGKFRAGDNNAWGIKDFRSGSPKFGRTRDFESWAASIQYTSELLFKYDPVDGMPDPKQMAPTWKSVRPYHNWIGNVSYALKDISQNVTLAAQPIG